MSRDFIEGLVSRPYLPVKKSTDNSPRTTNSSGVNFQDLLNQAKAGVTSIKMSAHALARLKQRGIELTEGDMNQLGRALDRAESKGSRDTYMVYGSTGFVVNVPNRTVVTAMLNTEDTVVTNVDSVVIVQRPDR